MPRSSENGLMSTLDKPKSSSAERMRRLRERRAADHAASLASVPDAPPRDPDELLLPAVEVTIEALKLPESSGAMAQLARVLAGTIDDARDQAAALRLLAPQLMKALEALGGSPAARARMPARPAQRSAPSKLAQIRSAHANSPAVKKRRGA
jgi:hypothetical protein